MNDAWSELADEVREEASDDDLMAGDRCPEDHCEERLHELHHPRDSRLGIERHPDAPETEVVCIHDGIVAAR